MTAFPALIPSSRVFTPGDRAHALLRSIGGRSTQVRHSNVVTGQQLQLAFNLLTEANMLAVQLHYINRRGQFSTFSLPSAIWSGTTDRTISGYSWRYISMPRVEEPFCGRFDVSLTLEMVAEYAPPATTGDAFVQIPRATVTVTALAPWIEGNPPLTTAIPESAVTVEALAPLFAVAAIPGSSVTVESLVPTIIGSMPVAAVAVDVLPAIAKTPPTWTLVGVGTVANTAGSSPDPQIPAGAQSGDLLVTIIAARSTPTFTPPAGWSMAASQSTGNTSTTPTSSIGSGAMAWVAYGATAPATQWTLSGGNAWLARVMVYRPSAGIPELISASGGTAGANSTTASTAGIEVDGFNSLIVAGFCGGSDTSVSGFTAATDPSTASGATDTSTAPTVGTWIERADSLTTSLADTTLAIADAVKAAPGNTGTIQAVAAVSSRHVMLAAAFRAA